MCIFYASWVLRNMIVKRVIVDKASFVCYSRVHLTFLKRARTCNTSMCNAAKKEANCNQKERHFSLLHIARAIL